MCLEENWLAKTVTKITGSFLIKWMTYYLNKNLGLINVVDKTLFSHVHYEKIF